MISQKTEKNMRKLILIIIAIMIFSGTLLAEITLYAGIEYNSFIITSENITSRNKSTGYSYTSTETPTSSGTSLGVNGGMIIDKNGRIHTSYFSGEVDLTPTIFVKILSVSYNYSFNNQGDHKGFYIGAGLSKVTTGIPENYIVTASKISSTGLLLRGGYEYKTDDNLLFDIGFNSNYAKNYHEYDYVGYNGIEGNMTMSVSNLNIGMSYLF